MNILSALLHSCFSLRLFFSSPTIPPVSFDRWAAANSDADDGQVPMNDQKHGIKQWELRFKSASPFDICDLGEDDTIHQVNRLNNTPRAQTPERALTHNDCPAIGSCNFPAPSSGGQELEHLLKTPIANITDFFGGALDLLGFPNALDPNHMQALNDIVTHREILMMRVMNTITDKSNWDKKVFDEHITSKWREEIRKSGQDVTPKMMDWIIKELQWKAGIFQETGHVTVFDVGVVKSDNAISSQLQQDLRQAASLFENVLEAQKDYHPGSDQKVVNLVHPSLFPVVYGRTRVLPDQVIGVDDCLSSMGQGTMIPISSEEESLVASDHESMTHYHIQPRLSRKFQWLPCEVDINDSECEITSYINNVHPVEHRGLYDVVEKIIARTIPLWDQSLTRGSDRHRIPYEEVEYGDPVGPEPMRPQHADDNFDEDEYLERHEEWEFSRPILLPEPGDFKVYPLWDSYQVTLDTGYFGHSGIQVVVKLANIELTPEKPDYEGGTWHIEGQLNERICATAIYYYDNQNITESSLSFRQRGTELDYIEHEQDRHEFLQDVYGLRTNGDWNGTEVTQELGGVVCQEGRLLTFPNSVQHKVSSFSLADRSKSGHRKILALFLIDPHRRVISSANVPPQREDWAPESSTIVNNVHPQASTNLPDTTGQDVPSSAMSMKEAEAYRLELMEERSVRAVENNDVFENGSFNLCEH
ncbi:Protein of unknown function DUF4246 [Penicillium concentricum]|uniref:JmjC domain-containing protein n=1 Tax=Penicillium concentricum TaxID=293559 RepID=A0A9W9RAJ8_9EURO|nr:Protein of unknown function DUF4246 [Penicillium concentricum]KAJ5356553.1 Protein of unknown function DUF4246 [Penicillium concentricum]